MNFFLHIGYPKCFSTTLQRNFFSLHPEIYYGGIGLNSNIDFINDEINLLIESGITYFNRTLFRKEIHRFKSAIDDLINNGIKSNKKAIGLSSEHLIFNFSPQGVDYQDKIDRINELFGSNTKILLIIRNQKDLIISLYKEYIKMGCAYTFDEFIEWLYKYQDRNFYFELMYGDVIEYILKYFKRENIFLHWFEEYKHHDNIELNKLFNDISCFLDLKFVNFDISNYNPSLPFNQIDKKIKLNKKLKFDFGSSHMEGIEDHRRRIYFNNYLNLNYDESLVFRNVMLKRKTLNLARKRYTNMQDNTTRNITINETFLAAFNNNNLKLINLFPNL